MHALLFTQRVAGLHVLCDSCILAAGSRVMKHI